MAKAQAEEMRTKRSDVQITAPFDPGQAMSGLEPLLQVGNKWFEGWMAVGTEILEFGRARLDRNLEASKAFARSSSIDQAVEVQVDYARSLMRDYVAEASKLADISTRALLEGLTAWQPAARGESAQRRPSA